MEVAHLNISLMENFDSYSHNIKLFWIRGLGFQEWEVSLLQRNIVNIPLDLG